MSVAELDPPIPMDPMEERQPEMFPADPPVPLLPEMLLRPGYPRPTTLDIRRGRQGEVVAQVDADDRDLPQLDDRGKPLGPGAVWVVARWPTGHGQARSYHLGAKRYVIEPPTVPVAAAPAIPLELSKALGDLAVANQANAAAMQALAVRMERLEHTPAPAPASAPAPQAPIGGTALMETLLVKVIEKALAPAPAPPPAPDPLAAMRAFFELQRSWQDSQPKPAATGEGANSTTAAVVNGIIETARDALDAIPEAAERVAKARMMQGLELLDPVSLFRQIPGTPDQTLAAWLARALQCGLIDLDVLGGGGIAQGADAAELFAEVMRWGPVGKSRCRTVVVGALRLLEGEGKGEAGQPQLTSGPGVSDAGSAAGKQPHGSAGADPGNGATNPPA